MSAAAMLGGDAGTTTAAAGDGATGATQASSVSAVTTAASAAQTASWIDSIATPEDKAYAQAKQFKEPGEVVGLYRNLEKLLGGEKIPMPKGEADKEGWDRVYKAVGRPETPDGYKIGVPEGGDPTFAKTAAAWFHEAGLSTKQANMIAQKYGEFGAAQQATQQAAIDAKNTAELASYKQEQGAQFEAQLEMGRRAAKQFGFSNDELVAIERAVGTKALLTRFASIGAGMGEHVVAGKGQEGFGPIGATAAQAQIKLLKEDKEFTAKYLGGDADAKLRMQSLVAASQGMTLKDYQDSLHDIGGRPRNTN